MMSSGKEGEKQMIELVREGIADALRYKVWPLLIQQPLIKYEDCEWIHENKDINLDL